MHDYDLRLPYWGRETEARWTNAALGGCVVVERVSIGLRMGAIWGLRTLMGVAKDEWLILACEDDGRINLMMSRKDWMCHVVVFRVCILLRRRDIKGSVSSLGKDSHLNHFTSSSLAVFIATKTTNQVITSPEWSLFFISSHSLPSQHPLCWDRVSNGTAATARSPAKANRPLSNSLPRPSRSKTAKKPASAATSSATRSARARMAAPSGSS